MALYSSGEVMQGFCKQYSHAADEWDDALFSELSVCKRPRLYSLQRSVFIKIAEESLID